MNSGITKIENTTPEEEFTIIIDIGEGNTKVGFAGDEKPIMFPTVVGKPKYRQTMMTGVNAQEIYVGEDTTKMRGVLKIAHPIKRGTVMDWDNYYAILNHIFFDTLRVDAKKCNVIYLVPPLTNPETYQYFAKVLFETHQVKSVAIIDTATTSVFSIGETTGLSIEIGCGLCTICPVMDGKIFGPSVQKLNLAGMDVEDYLEKLLTQYGIFQKREIIQDIKERTLKIAMDPNAASQDPSFNVKYLLPDGEKLELSSYFIIMAGEIIFNPILVGISGRSIQSAIIDSLRATDPNYWRQLLQKIVLSGGTSYISGLKDRLEAEIKKNLVELGDLPPIVDETTNILVPEPVNGNSSSLEDSTSMVQILGKESKPENCSRCGELLEKGSDFCQSCGQHVDQKQIEILGATHSSYPTICSKCFQKLDGIISVCPYCNNKLKPIISEDKLDRKEKKLLKKTSVSEKELKELSLQVESEYGGFDELEEINEKKPPLIGKLNIKVPKKDPEEIVQIVLHDDRFYAAFKGASVLGSLPSFKPFLVDKATFDANPDACKVDFYSIINQ
ncbi:zinc ribbon domain-containing protein [Promethearchaeum syntrophicum]|uniref:Zinc ribbon domain-containing protein n=1 Tax=Promethearchaeum syntrophicum TaxID=2594042 RepID=A0A5B9DDL8_9ARCH|nr:zinc ribbon domain-containing protein [Candidatus Prometheoarchaeum syntrophicum]QEE17409.1 Actin [Candidatus Prometheoarchaeum syntrophicum]